MTLTDVQQQPEIAVGQPIVEAPRPKRRQNNWILGGVLLAVLGGLLAAWLFASSTTTAPVLVARKDLQPGMPVSSGDFQVVDVGSSEGVDSIGADDQDVLEGMVPKAVIPSGVMVSESMFQSADEVIKPGQTVLSVKVSLGSVPSNLGPGQQVLLIDVGDESLKVITDGEVLGVDDVDGLGGAPEQVVTLVVDKSSAVEVAAAAHNEVLIMGAEG